MVKRITSQDDQLPSILPSGPWFALSIVLAVLFGVAVGLGWMG